MTTDQTLNTLMKRSVIFLIIIVISYLVYKQTRFYYNTPLFIPFSVRLNTSNLVLVVGESYSLKVQSVNKRVSYSSTDFKVADVLFTGKVIANRVGMAVINVEVGDSTVKCKVTVIDINKSGVTVGVGRQEKLSIRGTGAKVTWSSRNSTVATVDGDGTVTGQVKGTTTVIGKVKGKTLKCVVTVE